MEHNCLQLNERIGTAPNARAAGGEDMASAAREAELLPVRYFHLVFNTAQADRRYCTSETNVEIYNPADAGECGTRCQDRHRPKHLVRVLAHQQSVCTHGARDEPTHPHVHMIVAGGRAFDGWLQNGSPAARNFLPVRPGASRLYRRAPFWERAGQAGMMPGNCIFFGDPRGPHPTKTVFTDFLGTPAQKSTGSSYAKRTLRRTKAWLAYLSRFKQRIRGNIQQPTDPFFGMSTAGHAFPAFKKLRVNGAGRHTTMTLATE